MVGDSPRRHEAGTLSDDAGLNMTPMIDIVFQLLIFLLVGLKFQTVEQRIDSKLPKDGYH